MEAADAGARAIWDEIKDSFLLTHQNWTACESWLRRESPPNWLEATLEVARETSTFVFSPGYTEIPAGEEGIVGLLCQGFDDLLAHYEPAAQVHGWVAANFAKRQVAGYFRAHVEALLDIEARVAPFLSTWRSGQLRISRFPQPHDLELLNAPDDADAKLPKAYIDLIAMMSSGTARLLSHWRILQPLGFAMDDEEALSLRDAINALGAAPEPSAVPELIQSARKRFVEALVRLTAYSSPVSGKGRAAGGQTWDISEELVASMRPVVEAAVSDGERTVRRVQLAMRKLGIEQDAGIPGLTLAEGDQSALNSLLEPADAMRVLLDKTRQKLHRRPNAIALLPTSSAISGASAMVADAVNPTFPTDLRARMDELRMITTERLPRCALEFAGLRRDLGPDFPDSAAVLLAAAMKRGKDLVGLAATAFGAEPTFDWTAHDAAIRVLGRKRRTDKAGRTKSAFLQESHTREELVKHLVEMNGGSLSGSTLGNLLQSTGGSFMSTPKGSTAHSARVDATAIMAWVDTSSAAWLSGDVLETLEQATREYSDQVAHWFQDAAASAGPLVDALGLDAIEQSLASEAFGADDIEHLDGAVVALLAGLREKLQPPVEAILDLAEDHLGRGPVDPVAWNRMADLLALLADLLTNLTTVLEWAGRPPFAMRKTARAHGWQAEAISAWASRHGELREGFSGESALPPSLNQQIWRRNRKFVEALRKRSLNQPRVPGNVLDWAMSATNIKYIIIGDHHAELFQAAAFKGQLSMGMDVTGKVRGGLAKIPWGRRLPIRQGQVWVTECEQFDFLQAELWSRCRLRASRTRVSG